MFRTIGIIAALVAMATGANAQAGGAALRREARISEAAARATALKEVPGGTIKSSELEREHGKLIYSFDISVAGKSGVEEVNVNAIDGSIVAHEHENAAAARKEAAQEVKQKKAKK